MRCSVENPAAVTSSSPGRAASITRREAKGQRIPKPPPCSVAKKRMPATDPVGTTHAKPAMPATIITAPMRVMAASQCLGALASAIERIDHEMDSLAMIRPVVTGEKSCRAASSSGP